MFAGVISFSAVTRHLPRMCGPCQCGFVFRFCPSCGRRLHASTSHSSGARKGPVCTAELSCLLRTEPQQPAALPAAAHSLPSFALPIWQALLPGAPVSAFDVFRAVVRAPLSAAEVSEAQMDPVFARLRAWRASEAPTWGLGAAHHDDETALARTWLTAPGPVRQSCEVVASWWCAITSETAPDGVVSRGDDHAHGGAHEGQPEGDLYRQTAEKTARGRTNTATNKPASKQRSSGYSLPVRAASDAVVTPAHTKTTVVACASAKRAKRSPSSFDLFRRAVKRKSLTRKAVCELWASMTDSEKAPFDVQAAGLRTSGMLETTEKD